MAGMKGIDQAAFAKLQGTTEQTSYDLAGVSSLQGIKSTLACILSLGLVVVWQKYNAPSFEKLVSKFAEAAIKVRDMSAPAGPVTRLTLWGSPAADLREATKERANLEKQLADRVTTVISNEQTETVKKVVSTVKTLIKNEVSNLNKDNVIINAEVASVTAAIAKAEVEGRFADPLALARKESVAKAAFDMGTKLLTTELVPDQATGVDLINSTVREQIKKESQFRMNNADTALRGNRYRSGMVTAKDTLFKNVKTLAESMVATEKSIADKNKEIASKIRDVAKCQAELDSHQADLTATVTGPRGTTEQERQEVSAEIDAIKIRVDSAFTNLNVARKALMELEGQCHALDGTLENSKKEWDDKYMNKGIKQAGFDAYKAAYKANKETADAEALLVISDARVTRASLDESTIDANYLNGLYTS